MQLVRVENFHLSSYCLAAELAMVQSVVAVVEVSAAVVDCDDRR
jgi:hypothetical protein